MSRRGSPRTSRSRAAPWMKRSPPRETTLCGSAGRGSVPGVGPNLHGVVAPYRLATTRYRSSLEKNTWRGPRHGPSLRKSQGHVCVRCMPRMASVQVKHVLRLSVLLLIRWFRVRPPGAPPALLFLFSSLPAGVPCASGAVVVALRVRGAGSGQAAAGVFRVAVAGGPAFAAAGCARPGRGAPLWRRRGEGGEGCLAAPASCSGRKPGGGAALVFFLPGVPGGQDALVAARSSVVVNSMRGASPMRRHQPRAMSVAAGSLTVAKPRSAPVRRA